MTLIVSEELAILHQNYYKFICQCDCTKCLHYIVIRFIFAVVEWVSMEKTGTIASNLHCNYVTRVCINDQILQVLREICNDQDLDHLTTSVFVRLTKLKEAGKKKNR